MFPKEKFAEFLMMLLTFAKANGFSAAMCAKVFDVSHQTTARWMAQARRVEQGEEATISAYTFMVEPVVEKIERLNQVDGERRLYAAIAREKPETKLEILRGALDGRAV